MKPEGRVAGSSPGSEKDLKQLRRILLGREEGTAERLTELEERLDSARRFAEDVSRVLPEAVLLRARRDQALMEALQEPVQEAVGKAVRKDPQPLADAIFPVIGPAIRKAIASTLRELTQRFEQALQHAFSPRSLKWRFEAWRTGRPFAEIVLLKTLVYRVDQVFLIHKETGLLLQHVVADEVRAKDADLVSGMLTAIQDFVRDSFDAKEEDAVESLRVGPFTVWTEQGSGAVVAAVVRGTAPEELRGILKRALEHVETEMADDLAGFEGDAERFRLCRPYLEACLLEVKSRKRTSPLFRLFLFFAGVALFLWGGAAVLDWYGETRAWRDFVRRLDEEPGILVTHQGTRDGDHYVHGLRDPLSRNPAVVGKGLDLPRYFANWEPYHALEPIFVVRRARRLLDPPDTVELRFVSETLFMEGKAGRDWLDGAVRLAPALSGVSRVDTSGLVVEPEGTR